MPILRSNEPQPQPNPMDHVLALKDTAILDRDFYGTPASRLDELNTTDRVCGAPGCEGGWTVPWKNRQRPIFEQEWGCSARCLTDLVSRAVRRETGEANKTEEETPYKHRVPLGLVLLAQGWITHPQLQSALQSQRTSGRGRIGDWLTQSCGLREEHVTRGLGVQWNCPVLTTDGFSPAAMALVMPKRLIAEFGLLPLRVANSSLLYVAFEERMDPATALAIEHMSGLQVVSGLLVGTSFEAARASVLAADPEPMQVKITADSDEMTAVIVQALEQHQPLMTRLVRVHEYYWLRMWMEIGTLDGVGDLPQAAEHVEDYLFLMQ